MPGSAELEIEAWDYDLIRGDDLIVSTEIDIERRFYLNKRSSLKVKPIEIRKLK
jgi:hypothetical protein